MSKILQPRPSQTPPPLPEKTSSPIKQPRNNMDKNPMSSSVYASSGTPTPALKEESRHSKEPTIQSLLQNNSHASSAILPAHLRTGTNRMDIDDKTMTGLASWRRGQGFKQWEQALFKSPEVKRKADMAQLYFLDYYFDVISYLGARRARLATFKNDVAERNVTGSELASEWSSYSGRERVLLRKRRTKLHMDHFHIITQVGQGGYGEVYLARHRDTGTVCALKKMRKSVLAKMDEIKHILVERDILTSTKSPWLVKLLYAFQDPQYVYLAMEFVAGGDFRTLLNNSGVLKEEHARFYIAEMFLAVNALHTLGYIHRDLKPENFLIDSSGHIKLTDFGLAAGNLNPHRIEGLKSKLDKVKDQELIYRTTYEMRSMYKTLRMADPRYADSVVGSPDYMAPEVLRGHEYSFSVDYWSLGAVLFEFLSGFPPFSGAGPEETWNNLKNWQKCLRRPHYDREEDKIFNLSDKGWSAITSLLADKKTRFGTLAQVKDHPFFAGIKWDVLRDTKAPFVPALDSEEDAGYFDNFEDPADMAKYAEVKEKQRNVDAVEEKDEPFNRGVWVGFTFKPKGKIDQNEVLGFDSSAGQSKDNRDDDSELRVMF